MEEKNELNDIILNRSSGSSGMKKVMLAVASLAIVLIVVVVIMSTLNPEDEAKLPQPIEAPKASAQTTIEDDPLFEPVAIDETSADESLDDVAAKIKQQSKEDDTELITGPNDFYEEEKTEVVVPAKYEKPVKKQPKKVTKVAVKKPSKRVVAKPATKGNYYVQVGSFGKYSPDKKFLKKITDSGYTYRFHEVTVKGRKVTKVLVGPYATDKDARKDLKGIRSKIETGAFLSRI